MNDLAGNPSESLKISESNKVKRQSNTVLPRFCLKFGKSRNSNKIEDKQFRGLQLKKNLKIGKILFISIVKIFFFILTYLLLS